jgi:2-iminoacetate synthase ThiH
MNVQEMAINKRTALMMFWNAGISSMPTEQAEVALKRASDKLDSMSQPTAGYWYASDVSKVLPKGIGK